MGVGRERAELECQLPGSRGLCATDTARRRRRGVVAAPTSQHALPLLGGGHRARQHKHKLHLDHTPAGAWPEPADAVGEVDAAPRGGAGRRGQGSSVRTENPHPQNTRTLRPLANLRAETKPARFASGLGVDPPEGWVDWVGLFGYKRGGCAKEMKRAELALGEERRHRVVCFHCYKSPEQEAKSQQIVGQSLLSCLQYPVPYLSRLQRIYPSQHSKLRWSMMLGRSLS